MPIRAITLRGVLLLAALPFAASPAAAEDAPAALSDWLVIDPCGQSVRAPLHTDAIEHRLVTGAWRTPRAGDSVSLPGGGERTWREAKADSEGWLKDRALGGGYALAVVHEPQPRIAILDAQGHSAVYVNGRAIRAGDPYRTGWLRTPIQLDAGDNSLLFACGRGALRAALSPPPAAAFFHPRDETLPDLVGALARVRLGAVPVVNATDQPLADLRIEAWCGLAAHVPPHATAVPPLLPLAARKIGFEIPEPSLVEGMGTELKLRLVRGGGTVLDEITLPLRVKGADERYKDTFRSGIDGSVQYFAVTPAQRASEAGGPPGLILTLHGAGVEASGQAGAYGPSDWATIVAATNRRPFGFDWEDWGRLDALEVLDLAVRRFQPDPRRIHLTGHSMGGHGTWQLGVTFPDRWAAVAPSAGWISFASYTSGPPPAPTTDAERILARAANGCDTLALARNLRHFGVYVLHGDADDNVPVEQARAMRKRLAEDHADFAYYERPGAGHWWGNACVDWPPLMAFLAQHENAPAASVRHVEFWTANPAVSARCDWVTIDGQVHALDFSSADISLDPEKRSFTGTTRNVARLMLDLAGLSAVPAPAGDKEATPALPPGPPLHVALDGQTLEEVPFPSDGGALWLERRGTAWAVAAAPDPFEKNARRAGPFKQAFAQRFILVYGTRGDNAENAWALAKARFDAETFGYRGNGSVDVVADVDFDPQREPDRSVILYGNDATNARWSDLLADSPVRVGRGSAAVGSAELAGDDLACLLVRPRPGSAVALVGAVGGTGLAGMRLTERLPYFVSGVHYPDVLICTPAVLLGEASGVRAAGFFDAQWRIQPDDFAIAP